MHADHGEADFLAVFPLAGKGRARLVGTVRSDRGDRAYTLKFEAAGSSDRELARLAPHALRTSSDMCPPVCTENLSSGVVVMKSAQDGT
jgi:hypothetical protein